MEIDKLTIGEARELAALFGSKPELPESVKFEIEEYGASNAKALEVLWCEIVELMDRRCAK